MADYRDQRREGTRELARLLGKMAEEQSKAVIQAGEREMLYLQQFHLSQLYSENSEQLTAPVQKKPPPGYAAKFEGIEERTSEQLEACLDHLDSELRADQKYVKEREKVVARFEELEAGLAG